MTLSSDSYSDDTSHKVTYLSARSPLKSSSRGKKAGQPEGRVADLKRRIPILIRLIADCDHLATALDLEVRNEEQRIKNHDRAHFAYPIYAKTTALRRDKLKRSAEELRSHLTEARKALHELGETTADAWSKALSTV